MKIVFMGACRKAGKGYIKCSVKGMSEGDSVTLRAYRKPDNEVPCMIFPHGNQDYGQYVVVLPLFDLPVLELVFSICRDGRFDACDKLVKRVNMKRMKWESRLNYRFRKKLTDEIHAVDEQCDPDNIVGNVSDVIYSDDGVLVHIALSMLHLGTDEIAYTMLDNQGLRRSFPIKTIGSTLIPISGMLIRRTMVSIELPKGVYDFCLCMQGVNGTRATGFVYLHRNECLEYGRQFFSRTNIEPDEDAYNLWFQNHRVTIKTLKYQQEYVFDKAPLVSIIVPLYKTPSSYFHDMYESVEGQSYSNWELILVNASPDYQELAKTLSELSDPRVHIVSLDDNRGIVFNTNAGIKCAQGEFIAFLDHDDALEKDALFEYVRAINADDDCDLIYSDEDCFDDSGCHSHVLFKPDYNKDLLFSGNYITHFLMIRASLLAAVGMTPEGLDGAQDFDLTLRAANCARNVKHIALVLYHWRMHERSTSAVPESKPYAQEAGKRVLENYFESNGVDVSIRETKIPFTYETRFLYKEEPSIAIIIPNKDHAGVLDTCLQSLFLSDYSNYEIYIVENNSSEESTFEYYSEIERLHCNVHVLTYEGEFNFSKIVNYGVSHTESNLVLLLNNDTKVITTDFLQIMAGYFIRPEVGVVGAKLLYSDSTVQHGGVIVGPNGLADVLFHGIPDASAGYAGRACRAQDLSAVTGACQMIRRSVYEEIDGYSDEFAVEFNDVDFCLKARKAGYLVVYSPYAKLYHFEFTSRGQDTLLPKRLRSEQEKGLMHYKWPEYFVLGDPYYNPNLDSNGVYFKL